MIVVNVVNVVKVVNVVNVDQYIAVIAVVVVGVVVIKYLSVYLSAALPSCLYLSVNLDVCVCVGHCCCNDNATWLKRFSSATIVC